MFTDRLDLRDDVTNGAGGETSFTTKDGMHWVFHSINFGGTGAILTIDVDGVNKGPNCGNVQFSGTCEDENRSKGFDSFTMNIHPSGKIDILDCWAVRAISVDKKLITDTGCQQD